MQTLPGAIKGEEPEGKQYEGKTKGTTGWVRSLLTDQDTPNKQGECAEKPQAH